jgi:hypothetical protein
MSEFSISKKNWDKIQNYSRYAWEEHKSEIGGFMVVKKRKDGSFEMFEPVILEQEITAGNTIITKNALASYYNKTAMKHGTDNLHYCWWHSHHTMSAFWSGTDLTAIDLEKNNDWSCALVVNLRGEYKFRVNHWEPIETFKDIDIEIEGIKTKKVPKAIVNEVEELCTKPKKIVSSFWNGGQTSLMDTRHYTNSWNTGIESNQIPVFADFNTTLEEELESERDLEMIQIEAKYDNILTDYITDDDFERFKANVNSLNNTLVKDKSQLRVGAVRTQEMLDIIINIIDADAYIYRVGSEWDINSVFDKYKHILGELPLGAK